MAITYPLAIPGPIGESRANLKKWNAIGEVISPFAGSAQQQQWPDQHWELDLVWPEMTWAQFAALDAFAGALHGKLGSFIWGPPLAIAPRGTGLGAPVVASGVAGSNSLGTSGWTASQSGLLLPGDFLELNVTTPRLHQYIGQGPLVSDGAGNATIDLWPSIREAPVVGAAVILMNAQGTFRLADNRREAPADRTKTFTFQLKAREAI